MHVFLILCLLFTSSPLLAMNPEPMDTEDDSLTGKIAQLAVAQRSLPIAIPKNEKASPSHFSFSPLCYSPARSTTTTPDVDERKPSPSLSSVGTPSTPSTLQARFSDSNNDGSGSVRSHSVPAYTAAPLSVKELCSDDEAHKYLKKAYWGHPGQQAAPYYDQVPYEAQRTTKRSASASVFSRLPRPGCLELDPNALR